MTKEDYKWFKDRKICTQCRKEKVYQNKTMCIECLDKIKEMSEKYRSQKSKEQRKKYIKRKRELCIAFGVCRECLKKPAKVGLKCTECYAKELQRRERNRKTVKRNIRVELGLCYFCGDPVVEGKRTCKKHLQLQGNKFKKWHNENRDNSNHIWRKIQAGEVRNIQHYRKMINA